MELGYGVNHEIQIISTEISRRNKIVVERQIQADPLIRSLTRPEKNWKIKGINGS